MNKILTITLLLIGLVCSAQYGPRQAAYDFNKRLGRGINFMAVKINQGYHDPFDFALIKKNKFTHVRIGSRIWQYVGDAPDFTIEPEKLLSYHDAVDWALDHDLMVVMDPIHAWEDYSDEDLPKLTKLWEQIANSFANYPIERVAFELFNEPRSYDFSLKDMIDSCLYAVREIPANEERIVIVSGQSFSTRQALIDAFNDNIVFPVDDHYLMGTFHYYDPREFTKQGDTIIDIHWADGGDNDPEWIETIDKFHEVVTANENWAETNYTVPLPIYNGEYGCDNGAPPEDRIRWLWWVRMVSEQMGFSNALWNLYNNNPSSKGLGPWTDLQKNDPTTRYLDQNVLNPYRNRYECEKALFNGSFVIEPWEGASDDTLVSLYNGTAGDFMTINDVYIAKSGNYDITLRYQNNSTDSVFLYIASMHDLQAMDSVKLELAPSNGEWNSVRFPLDFITDTNNNIILRFDTSVDSFQFDYLAITNGIFYDNLYPSVITNTNFVGLKENKKAGLNIYPNPSTHNVTIRGDIKQWKLYNANGEFLFSGTNKTIFVGNLDSGIYYLIAGNKPLKLFVK